MQKKNSETSERRGVRDLRLRLLEIAFFSVIRNNLSPQDSSGAALTDGSALVVTLRKEGSSIFASPTPSSAVI